MQSMTLHMLHCAVRYLSACAVRFFVSFSCVNIVLVFDFSCARAHTHFDRWLAACRRRRRLRRCHSSNFDFVPILGLLSCYVEQISCNANSSDVVNGGSRCEPLMQPIGSSEPIVWAPMASCIACGFVRFAHTHSVSVLFFETPAK